MRVQSTAVDSDVVETSSNRVSPSRGAMSQAWNLDGSAMGLRYRLGSAPPERARNELATSLEMGT